MAAKSLKHRSRDIWHPALITALNAARRRIMAACGKIALRWQLRRGDSARPRVNAVVWRQISTKYDDIISKHGWRGIHGGTLHRRRRHGHEIKLVRSSARHVTQA